MPAISLAKAPQPAATNPAQIRNFCIIAHIDHGKSTLADRMLGITEVVEARNMRAQYLDRMDIERERGITIKSQAVRLPWRSGLDGQEYVLNMIDTPGHVDFTYEVSRSLAACEGAVLLVDCAQGIEAQTLANLYLAMENNLTIIPVLNKIDLPNAQPEKFAAELAGLIGCKVEDVLKVSGKTGDGLAEAIAPWMVGWIRDISGSYANGFSTLVTAVVTAELLPALSDPFSEYTVFAPTNQAFTDLATALNTDLNGILALPNLADILLYHVVDGAVLSTQLTAGPVATLEGSDVVVSLTGGVKINDANVTLADVLADNGVVHVLDKVILESYLGIDENNTFSFGLFPNPSNGLVTINGVDNAEVIVSDLSGKTFLNQSVNNNSSLDLNGLSNGTYLVTISQNGNQSVQTLVKF